VNTEKSLCIHDLTVGTRTEPVSRRIAIEGSNPFFAT
jgi:hypothetical protein